MASNPQDVEKGIPDSYFPEEHLAARPSTAAPSEPRRKSTHDDLAGSDTTRSPLADFRFAVGIHTHSELREPERPAENRGIYQRVVKAEKASSKSYRIFAVLINGALGLQIVFAAALTALGASGARASAAVTAFGAMNTILAGFLTFLKGSGLPNRLKYYHNEWSKVREYIEQRERDFARGMEDLDLREEVATIELMYENVRKDVEANTPDSYISIGTGRNGGTVHPIPPLARHFDKKAHNAKEKIAQDIDKKVHDLEKNALDTQHKILEHVEKQRQDAEDKFSALAEKMAEKVLDFARGQSRS